MARHEALKYDNIAMLRMAKCGSPNTEFVMPQTPSLRTDTVANHPNDPTHKITSDVTVYNPNASCHQSLKPWMNTGVVATKADAIKNSKYQAAAKKERKVDFHPVAFESYGAWSNEAKKYIKKISKLHGSRLRPDLWSPTSTTFMSYWLQRISTTLRRTQAELILDTYTSHNLEDHLC